MRGMIIARVAYQSQELSRPSFRRLSEFGCTFVFYEDVEQEWRNLKKQQLSRFR